MVVSIEKTGSAMLLEPAGVQMLDTWRALKYVIAPLLKNHKNHTNIGTVYGVLVYGKHEQETQPNVLIAADAFLRAYRKVLNVLRQSDPSVFDDAARNRQRIEIGDVQFYLGQASEAVLKQKVALTPGMYIMTGILDANVLESLNLPLLPERFRKLPMIAQVKDLTGVPRELIEIPYKEVPCETVDSQMAEEIPEQSNRDSLEWRREFLRSIPYWNSAQVAEQAASTASNKAALASRWLNEKKIFAIKASTQVFPQFQFQDGYPIPAVARVIDLFPQYATGWDLAYFFSAPNSFIGGRRPFELLRTEPDRVISLAETFVHPANAF